MMMQMLSNKSRWTCSKWRADSIKSHCMLLILYAKSHIVSFPPFITAQHQSGSSWRLMDALLTKICQICKHKSRHTI